MNELKSYTEYAVSTPTADFVIGFDFNYGEDAVNVTVDDVPATEAGYTVVYLNETTIRLSPSVPSGVVRLQRETDIDQTDHAYRAGAKFIAQTMDENFEQLRHAQQEVRDGFSKLSTDTYEIINGLDAALELAQDAAQDAQDAAVIAQGAADTVNTIIVGGKVGASNVLDATGETQQKINDGIASIDELRLIDPKKKGCRVYLNSVIADKNLGAGTFVSTTKGSLIDNGGTIVDSANPNLMWVRVEYDVMTPEMFGCIGDGVSDDTAGMLLFAAAKHSHKVAANDYALTATPVFNIEHDVTVIDFSKSTIIGTNFARNAIQVITSRSSKLIKFLAGSYDGGGVVNNYVELSSLTGGFSDEVVVECYGVLKNFANEKNTSTTAPIKCGISCDIGKIINPVVYNVHNKNGISGTTSACGVFLSNYRKLGYVINPTIEGVTSVDGIDADGILLFEEKSVPSTGQGIGFVLGGNLKQCSGRFVKSQSNLVVRNLILTMRAPSVGVINPNWRGIDAQLGNLNAHNIEFDLGGVNLFNAAQDTVLFMAQGNPDGLGVQSIKNIRIKGDTKIRYLMMLPTNDVKAVYIEDIKLIDPQSNLSCLYVIAGVQVKNEISIKNLSGGWFSGARIIFDTYLTKRCARLTLKDVQWTGYRPLYVSMFDQVRINAIDVMVFGILAYTSIHKSSRFFYETDGTALGGLTYSHTAQNIPSWAKRSIWYDSGTVYSGLRNNVLTTMNGTTFYQSVNPAPVIVPNPV